MKYLFNLRNDLIDRFDELTPSKVQLQILNGELPDTSQTIAYTARFYLLDCRLQQPFDVLGFIRKWFEHHAMSVPQLMFDCDVIDLESYDLQIDLLLSDKLNILDDGTTSVCPELVWSDEVGAYIANTIIASIT